MKGGGNERDKLKDSTEEKIRILVVDDERMITMYMEELLTSMGYSVVGTASNGRDAVTMARKLKPDIIIMDIIMPGELSGIQASEIIKEELEIPVVFVTAYADDVVVSKAKQVGPLAYIVKPFQGPEIKAAIEVGMYRMEMEEKLKSSENKYRMLVETSRDGIFILQDGMLKFCNTAITNMMKGQCTCPGENLHCILGCKNPDVVAKIEKNIWAGETINVDIGGENFPRRFIELQSVETTYEGKRAMLCVARDVTEKRTMDILSEQLISEMNDNLQVLMGFMDMYKETHSCEADEMANSVLTTIQEISDTRSMIYTLMKCHGGNTKTREMDVNHILESTMKLFQERCGASKQPITLEKIVSGHKIISNENLPLVIYALVRQMMGEVETQQGAPMKIFTRTMEDDKAHFIDIVFEGGSQDAEIKKLLQMFKNPYSMMENILEKKDADLSFIGFCIAHFSGTILEEDAECNGVEIDKKLVLRFPAAQ